MERGRGLCRGSDGQQQLLFMLAIRRDTRCSWSRIVLADLSSFRNVLQDDSNGREACASKCFFCVHNDTPDQSTHPAIYLLVAARLLSFALLKGSKAHLAFIPVGNGAVDPMRVLTGLLLAASPSLTLYRRGMEVLRLRALPQKIAYLYCARATGNWFAIQTYSLNSVYN